MDPVMASREAIAEVKREENVDLSGTSSPEIGHDTVRKELPKRNKGPPKPKGRDRERSKSLVRARVTRTTAQKKMIAQALTPKSRSMATGQKREISAFSTLRVEGEEELISALNRGERKRSTFEKRKSLTINNVDPTAVANLAKAGGGGRATTNKIGEWRLPSSRFRFYWEVFNFILYTSNAFLIPSRIVFGSRGSIESEWITGIALFIQLVFFVDLIFRCFAFALEEKGIVISKHSEIFMRYLNTWFTWDILGFFPFYFVARGFGIDRAQAIPLLACQMLKLVRYFSFWRYIEVYCSRNQLEVSAAFIEISKVIILIVILLVVFGCVLITIGCPDHYYSQFNETAYCDFADLRVNDTESWMEAGGLPHDIDSNFMNQINSAVYVVAQALYTIGYGDVTVSTNLAEKIFTSIMMLVGSFSFAVTIAVMSSVIANQDILYMEFRQNMESLNDYMHHHAMPEGLQLKLQNHFSYLYAMQYGKLEVDILAHLPKSLRTEVMKLNVPLLEAVPFCKGLKTFPILVEEMAKLLKPRTYSPHEAVVVRDAPIRQIFIIRNGKVNMILPSDDKSTLTSLLVGDHFGSFEFFFGTPSEYGYITASFTELLSLARKDFEDLMLSPMFDTEARSIDFTVSLITSELFPEAIGRRRKKSGNDDEGAKGSENGDVAPKEIIEELTKWSKKQAAVDSTIDGSSPSPPRDQHAFFGSSPPLGSSRNLDARNRRASRGKRPSFHRDSSVRSSSSLDDEGEGEKFLGIVLTFLDWREQRKKRQEKVEQMQKNMGKKNKFSEMMDESEDEEKPRGVILANSLFREIWDVTLLVNTTWASLAIPYRLYVQSRDDGNPWGNELGFGIFVDYVFDVFCIINIILNARYFANTEINEQGKQINIVDRELIFGEYWHSGRMIRDIVIAIPYDLLGFAFGAWNFCRVPKMLAAFRFPYLVSRLKDHLNRRKRHITLDTVLAANLTIASIVFTHWFSCFWGMLGENIKEEKGDFVAAIYFSLTTMTTVGFGDITPASVNGRWFVIAMMILGSCFTAGVIANITAMAHKIEIAEDNVQHVTTCVEKYMLEKELPFDIVERCNRYFQMLNHMQDSAKIERTLIPPAFLPAIANHNHKEVMISSPIFFTVKSSSGLTQSIAMLLKEQIVVQGDWVIHNNPSHDQWYYLKEGVVFIKSEKGELMDSMKTTGVGEGTSRCFGEYSLFNLKKHFHAYAHDNCLLTSLHPVSFRTIEMTYPEEFKIMREFAEQVVKKEADREPLKMAELKTSRRNSIMDVISASTSKILTGSANQSPLKKFISTFRGDRVCSPESHFQLYWNMFIFTILSYNLFMIPFRLAFVTSDTIQFVVLIDYFGDLMWLLDSKLRMTSFAYMEGDKVIKDKKKIRARYFEGGWYNGRSLYDILSLLPIELCLLGVSFGGSLTVFQTFSAFRGSKILRLGWASEHIRCIDVMFGKLTNNSYKNELKVSKLLFTILLSAHWLGCFFFLIAYIENEAGASNWADCDSSDIKANHLWGGCPQGGREPSEPKSTLDKYVRSVYWATTALTTAGYGDVSATTQAEQGFSIFVLVIGTLLFATVIANLEEIVAQVDVTSTLFQMKVDEVKAFMTMRNISLEVVEEVGRYYETLWLKQRGAGESDVLSYLPNRIRHEVLKHHCDKMLTTAPVFEKFEHRMIDLILDSLVSDFFLKGDTVYEKGECATELFLVTRGDVDLLDGKDKFMTVRSPSLLGEGEFFNHEPRYCAAVAVDYTCVFILEHTKLTKLLGNDVLHEEIFRKQIKAAADRIDTTGKMEKMKQNLKKGGKMAQMMMLNEEIEEKKDLVFLPDSVFKRRWDMLLMFVTTCNFVFVPLRVAFYGEGMRDDGIEWVWFGVGLLFDILFWVDMYFNIRLFAIIREGLLVNEREDFRSIYLKGQFKWDLLASLPCDAVVYLAGGRVIRTVALVRCARFVHLGRLPSLLQSMIDFAEENGFRYKAGIWNCLRMVFFVLLTTHWFACILYYLAVLRGLKDEMSWTSGTDLEDENLPIKERYTTSLYWSVYTITLVGYGDITLKSKSEMAFAVVSMLMGSVLCDAGITAIMSSLVNAMDASAGQANAWSQVIAKYVKHRQLSDKITDMIFRFFVHQHLSEDNLDEVLVLQKQPRSVRRRLLEDICFAGMVNFAPLKPYKPGFVKSICHRMQPYMALPAEIVIAKGESADKVFLVVKGKIQVLEKKEGGGDGKDHLFRVSASCEDGSIIGDFKPNLYTFRAVEYTECYVLHIDDYIDCFSFITQSPRGRKASKKNLADDFANLVQETQQVYGTGFMAAKKERRQTSLNLAISKVKGIVSKSSGRSIDRSHGRSSSSRDDALSSGKGVSVVPIME
mmetsp:Transcript_18981/g.39543  ORF Transcript_18981/g.39543 Transcript_18981/m.39543 type:complete len:2349 (+) Transcript_18981:25-7071(+)